MRREKDKKNDNKRIISFLIIVSILFAIIIGRLFYLQIIKGEEYNYKATRNSLKSRIVPTLRGKIYDVNGVLLATNKVGYKLVYINVPFIGRNDFLFLRENKESNREEFILNLDKSSFSKKSKQKLKKLFDDITDISNISKMSFDEILIIINSTVPQGIDREVVIKSDIPVNVALMEVEKIKNDNIDIVEYDKRYYPEKEIASHIVGYVKDITDNEYELLKEKGYSRNDTIGKKAIEKKYDELLRGSQGIEFVEVDARGNIIDKIDNTPPIEGANIYLSINEELQKYMTEEFHSQYGVFIAIEVKTGKILTMISSPEIDLNLLSTKISVDKWNELINSKDIPLVNKAVAGLFPPGSTFKVVSGTAILDGGISPEETIFSTGAYKYANTIFRDSHRRGHGETNFFKSMEESVNTYYYNYIQEIDRDRFFEIAKEFNLGQRTGIDLTNELSGVLPTPEWKKKRFKKREEQIWYPGDLINMSIGQGFLLVTPIQIASIYQTIANDGVMLKPQLVDKIVYSDKTEKIKPEIIRKIDVVPKVIKNIQKSLTLPVKGKKGTAKILNLPYVDVSAKTGTAQNSSGFDHSWMAGYFPSNKPEIAFVALVEEGGYGGVAAGERVKSFIEKYYEIKNRK